MISGSVTSRLAACMLVLTIGAAGALAVQQDPGQPTPQRTIPQQPALEWTQYSNPEAGIELLVPPGEPQPSDDSNVLHQVSNGQKQWHFELRRLLWDQPVNLAPEEMPEGGRRAGLLELVATAAQQKWQGDFVREPSLTPLGDADAGVFALRYKVGTLGQLRQVALIRASDLLYYQITLVSQSPDLPPEQLARDESVREAVEAFSRSLDSFRVLDQTQLRREQEERLIRTRALLVNLTKPRLMASLVPEQYWRIRKDGQDIGYSYLVEEPARQVPPDPVNREQIDPYGAAGVRIGIRTRLRRDGGWLDRETWLYASSDLKEEDFRERNQLIIEQKPSAENLVVGLMRAKQMPRKIEMPGPGGLGRQSGFTVTDVRRLEVTYVMNGVQTNEPLNRQLPAWYIPQAAEHLLPRLVAPWGRNTYLVAVYNPEKREVYQKYVDVEGLRNERVQDEMRLVMVVTTRVGLSGPRTRNFVDPDTYRWLGSVSEEDGLEIWPSDAQTLRQIWENPQLTAPDARPREGTN
jgi:hypothetical protein